MHHDTAGMVVPAVLLSYCSLSGTQLSAAETSLLIAAGSAAGAITSAAVSCNQFDFAPKYAGWLYIHTYIHTYINAYLQNILVFETFIQYQVMFTHTILKRIRSYSNRIHLESYIHTHTNIYNHAHMHNYIHTYMYTYVPPFIKVYIHTNTYTHIYA